MTLGQYQRHLAEFPNGNLGTSATLDFHVNGIFQSGVLNSTSCVLTFNPPREHSTIWIELIQDATGGRAVTFPGTVIGALPTINFSANASTLIGFIWNGTNYQIVSYSGNNVINDSSVSGVSVKNALDTLNANIGLGPSAASLVPNWYVDASAGNDSNDGKTSGTAFATLDKLNTTLCPGGSVLKVSQNTTVNLAAGTYNSLELNLSFPVGSNYTFNVISAYTSSAPITLTSVVNTVESATPTRGRITTASGTFVDKLRIRSTSGANAGAITYCTGLTSSTDAFVKTWLISGTTSIVNIANGTTCVVDTLTVTINRVQIKFSGSPVGGTFHINDTILLNGAEIQSIIGGSSLATLVQCQIGNSSSTRVSGNIQLYNCRLNGTVTFLNISQPVLYGCVFEGAANMAVSIQILAGTCFNGCNVAIGSVSVGKVQLANAEWVNGSGTAISTTAAATILIIGQQYGFGTSYSVGFALAPSTHVVVNSLSYLGILATQQITMAGNNVSYSQVPINYPNSDCSVVLATDATSTANLYIPGQTSGDMIYYNGTNWVRLVAGSDGYVLTTHGISTAPNWKPTAPIVNGNLVTGVNLDRTIDNSIATGLGRNYIGWFITRRYNATGFVDVFESSTVNTSPNIFLILNCLSNITVDIWIF